MTLLGQNVNTFGRDVTVPGSSRRPLFADLLRMVNQVDGLRRIRFTSPHPHDFTPDVIEAMAESEKVCEHIHFPLQSGSDRVLRAMRRSYRRERYLDWLATDPRARSRTSPSRPTSSWGSRARPRTDFAATLEVVDAARFDSAYMFQYSPRPGTRAATMDDQVPKEVVQERFDRLAGPAGRDHARARTARRSDGRSRCSSRARAKRRARPSRGPGRTGSCTWPTAARPGTFADARVTEAARITCWAGWSPRPPLAV